MIKFHFNNLVKPVYVYKTFETFVKNIGNEFQINNNDIKKLQFYILYDNRVKVEINENTYKDYFVNENYIEDIFCELKKEVKKILIKDKREMNNLRGKSENNNIKERRNLNDLVKRNNNNNQNQQNQNSNNNQFNNIFLQLTDGTNQQPKFDQNNLGFLNLNNNGNNNNLNNIQNQQINQNNSNNNQNNNGNNIDFLQF